jgi:hypothetical protein
VARSSLLHYEGRLNFAVKALLGPATIVMSRDIPDGPDLHQGPVRLSGAMVAAFGVDGEGADNLAGGGVDDACVVAVDEQDDGGSVEGSTDAEAARRETDY